MTSFTPLKVVVIDDSIRDIELFTTACELGEIDAEIQSFTDGQAFIDVLRHPGPLASRPDVIVLDLNMPSISGYDMLRYIKTLDALRTVRVFILTTSNSPKDRESCERLGCDRYLVKPTSFKTFVDMLKQALAEP